MMEIFMILKFSRSCITETGIKSDELEDTFTDIYCSFMYEVNDIDSSELDDKIPLITNQCYGILKSLIDIDNRVG